MKTSGILRCLVLKLTDISKVLTASNIRVITQMMEAVHTSEALVHFYKITWRHIPEGCRLHICRYNNLKSHLSSYKLEFE
jgi:hypothetical protein